jgi:hypothetical protein
MNSLQGAIVSVSKKKFASLGHEAHEMMVLLPLFIQTTSKKWFDFLSNH